MFVITGGGSGIGKALALSLVRQEKEVLIIGRREHALQETAAASERIQVLCADVGTKDGLEVIRSYLSGVPQISALINNAGTLEPFSLLQDMDSSAWQNALSTNLNAALYLPQILFNQLQKGRVLNIGTGAAYFAIKGWGAYCVSKAALAMLTQCWRLESEAVSFASAMPGISDTHMQELARSTANPDHDGTSFYQRLKDQGRLVSADTVALFLTWLLLDVDKETYVSKEWDIYDTTHHSAWLKPPHQVLHWDF